MAQDRALSVMNKGISGDGESVKKHLLHDDQRDKSYVQPLREGTAVE